MLIMPVQMFVCRGFVTVQMDMAFSEMKPNAQDHQATGNPVKDERQFRAVTLAEKRLVLKLLEADFPWEYRIEAPIIRNIG